MTEREIYFLKRKKSRITMSEIAIAIGCSQSLISRYESGQREMNQNLISQYKRYIDQKT
ncbi:helix-turn-helix domain-containing protein [Priestia megaterium]|nr:helix-turn-helix domain-containing protein [Priestia megaterium]